MRNVAEVGELCTGCGTCVAICPPGVISMEINHDRGVYEPVITGGCDGCGLCLRVCPGIEVDLADLNMRVFGREPDDPLLGNYEACYVGHSMDDKIRYDSSSGGMITQILLYLLEEGLIDGALVTRMNPERPLEPEPFIARTPEDIIEARGSKYCPVPANVALREIIEEPGRYAVVGLPCHIHGIRKAQKFNRKLRERIVYHLGIVCNHTPTFKATLFLLERVGVKPEDVQGIHYRGEGWPGSLRVETGSGDILLLPEYWGSGFGQLFMPGRCRMCCDHMAELSDMSFADPWLKEFEDEKKGRTLIIQRKHPEILQKISGICEIEPIEPQKVLLSQLYNIYMKKKVHKLNNGIYHGNFPEVDSVDRIIFRLDPDRLKIPFSLKRRYEYLYSVAVSLKARKDFSGDSK
ncbi:Coenzyme F420 hydrogenase/dehydrogenase, beta subunit C-terminal domain [Methanothermobacter sp. THM-2]|uniref:Coenzyme F420 hydrogenase/dehydrogenase, beta subunit C-terminal domain n=1 Tax=Methanothermobacter sp. THM-2 TaxID=2606912 RepID=UPI001365A6F5|nr:Coenzyme F420 hydrogenase/dehydrogenase, beta subunit C-terminal domain [Methanothermobacter sp. THM-2]QHN08750.1 4Fe-4S dicluster domain-containing protein [Methanothermobacter sp. THM-2]